MAEIQLDQIMHKVPIYVYNQQENLHTVNSLYVTSTVPLCSSLLQAHLSLLPLQQKVLYPSKIGLYPVHLHRLPNNQRNKDHVWHAQNATQIIVRPLSIQQLDGLVMLCK